MNFYHFEIVEKSYDGIFAIELTHKTTEKKLLLISCYLPPENSPYGRDCDGFFSHLEQICYNYCNEYDLIMFCGDVNARIGKMHDYEVDIDTSLPERIAIDLTENSHGQTIC